MNNTISIAERTDIPPDVASSSNEYAKRFAGEAGAYFLETQKNCVVKLLSNLVLPNENPKILELGGGHCQLLDTYLDLGFFVTIQGSDERSFIRPTELGYKNNAKIFYLELPINKLETIPDNSYDIVSGIRLMAHIANWQNYLEQALRISKHGIIFDYASLYTINILSPILFSLKKRIEKNTRPFYCQSSSDVIKTLNKHGAKEVDSIPQFIFPMGIHRIIKSKALSQKLENLGSKLGLSYLGSPVVVFAKK